MIESNELLRLRKRASDMVDFVFVLIQKRCQFSSDAVDYCRHFQVAVNVANTAYAGHVWNVVTEAYKHGQSLGFRDVRRSFVFNQKGFTETNNNKVTELWHLATDKATTSFRDMAHHIARAVKKAFTKKNDAKSLVRPSLEQLKKKTKVDVQDAITSAVAEGILDAYESAGIQKVMAKIETVKDNRRCARCAELEGKLYTIEQVRQLLPIHKSCRCLWRLRSTKGAKKPIMAEQRDQEYNIKKLRERLDRKYRQKKTPGRFVHVHNKSTVDAWVWDSDLTLNKTDSSFYVAIPLDSFERGSVHLLLANTRGYGTVGRAIKRKQLLSFDGTELLKWTSEADNGTRLIPAGLLLRVNWLNPTSGAVHLSAIGYGSGVMAPVGGEEFARAVWRKSLTNRIQTVPILPGSLSDYPYRLAMDVNGVVSVIMLNPRVGFIKTGPSRTALLCYDELLKFILDKGLVIL